MKDSVQTFYEKEAKAYDAARFKSKIGILINRIQTEIVLDFFQSEFGDLILEVGTGTGRFITKLAAKGLELIGLDTSKTMITKAHIRARTRKVSERINFVLADAHNIPIKRGSCNFCVSINVINHIPKYGEVINEIAAVLRSNSYFVVNFPYTQGLLFPVALTVRLTKRALFEEVYSNWFTLSEIRNVSSKANLNIESFQGFFIPDFPFLRIQSAIFTRILAIVNSLFRRSFLKYASGVLYAKLRKL